MFRFPQKQISLLVVIPQSLSPPGSAAFAHVCDIFSQCRTRFSGDNGPLRTTDLRTTDLSG